MHNIKQFGTGSDLIITTHDVLYRIYPFFFASFLRHSRHSTEIPMSIFSIEFTMKSEIVSITLCCFLYLQHKFWIRMASLLAVWQLKIQPPKCISCFSHIFHGKISPNVYTFLAVLFSKWLCVGLSVISIFKCKHHYTCQWCARF